MRAIGLMSGTSMDGVDVALIDTDGTSISGFGPTGYRAYGDEERALLREALKEGAALHDRLTRTPLLAKAEDLITRAHAEAVEAFLATHGLSRADIGVVGFHGQTVIHRPDLKMTVQIGDGLALRQRLGIPVVYDLRQADIAAGGQGAPLVPVFHRALATQKELPRPLAVVNVGGVANVTFIGSNDELTAFDTGPGNALIDDWMRERTGKPLDDNGVMAARGRGDEALLAWLLVHPFFAKSPPKSLDRNAFAHRIVGNVSTEDGAATLTTFTARSIARAADFVRERPVLWIVCGGGARNAELLRLIAYHTRAEVRTGEQVGWSSDFLEAQAFAFLAVRSMAGLPLTFPSTTGVREPVTGGVLAGA
ncbi:anhydro-N-acetylmuramic acid kinase [Phreatobacter sp. AB_2022a]|uniref:anhydro-N-acetylmuramic acid kinase n=1 Tax=Phreatobacter sp. AB_2022a TaxID=3003134 RepID=UPI002286FDCC|nr:anhydro-N-acetylmuramic acid kinase [Phreatobacter sp. AB_2022a]MCZ0733918.1 anhydro-N-acetylmuramic acid kinase [Phreatobacter sp. AB_2022a]